MTVERQTTRRSPAQVCEHGPVVEATQASQPRWLAENAGAIDGWNRHVAEHGLPLASYVQF